MKKRGVSGVVTSILLILLAVAAVVIVWAFVLPMIKNIGGEGTGIESLTVNLDIKEASIQGTTAYVKIKRGPGEGDIDKIKLVFSNDSGQQQIETINQSIAELETKTFSASIIITNPTKLEIYPVFIVNGKEKIGLVKADSVVISNGTISSGCSDADGDGYGTGCALGNDCDDSNNQVHSIIPCSYNGVSCGNYNLCLLTCPSAPAEVCDGVDNDCDGSVDEGCVTCQLNSASWSKSSAVEGEQVSLNVVGTGCDGLQISFEVKEDDGSIGEDGSDDPAQVNPANAVFSAGQVTATWTAEWQNDCLGFCNPPEYYFIASLVSDSNIKKTSGLLVVSQAPPGCADSDGDTYYGFHITNCPTGNDCDDRRANTYPGAPEICFGGLDNDCDPYIDCLDSDCATNSLCNGLVAQYSFEDNANDLSGNNYHGSWTGTAAYTDGAYPFSKAADFNGVDKFISVPDSTGLDLTTGTISFWVYFVSSPSASTSRALIVKGNSGGSADNYRINIPASSTKLGLGLGDGTSSQTYNLASSISAGSWHHFAATWDGLTISLYLDSGVPVTTTQTIIPATNNLPLVIGTLKSGFFPGIEIYVDELRIYNRALTSSEIAQLS